MIAILAVAGLIAGCSAATKVAQTTTPTTLAGSLGDHGASTQDQTAKSVLAQDALSAPPAPVAPPEPKGQCDARTLTYLIGHPRTDIPVPADLSHRRVACTTCPAEGAYQPTRTNILFNANTGIITAVTCG